MRQYRKWREIVIEQLAADWEAAIDYIQFAIEEYQVDGDTSVFLLALRTFVESQGGIVELSKRTGVDEEVFSQVLSCEETPRLDMLVTILTALGGKLSISPLEVEMSHAEMGNVDASVTPIDDASTNMEPATDNR